MLKPMKRYTPDLMAPGDGRVWATMIEHQIGQWYSVADVEARLMYLQRRLFECESAMLMGHCDGVIRYCNKHPEPMEAPSAN